MSNSSKLPKQEESNSRLLNLPEEISNEIFLKSPAKSISSSRCVCKRFYHLLSNPNFIKNHHAVHNKTDPKFMFKHMLRFGGLRIYSIGIEDYASISSSKPVLIDYPFKGLHSFDFLGSCNGLICLKISILGDRWVSTYYFSILNPLTREYKERELTEPRSDYGVAYGFGCGSNNDDYKLVTIGCSNIDVYTLRSDSWTSVQGNTKYEFDNTGKASKGVFFNGCLHWLGRTTTRGNSSAGILCFHVSNEGELMTMSLPENVLPPANFEGEVYRNVGVWGDCIGIAFIWESVRIDVWVMQQYGVKESWFKQFTRTTNLLPSLSHIISFWKPLWCFENGEILVEIGGKQLLLYGPTTERVRSVTVRDISIDNSGESYVESLVSLGSGTYLN